MNVSDKEQSLKMVLYEYAWLPDYPFRDDVLFVGIIVTFLQIEFFINEKGFVVLITD